MRGFVRGFVRGSYLVVVGEIFVAKVPEIVTSVIIRPNERANDAEELRERDEPLV